ncbi:hypothetical protein OnM2_039027 [Erysiphe neolycopersici]|uniref:Uncharacterized protein n=1 Tax=Erysiphe neolycopersici TaxID=212602 RepID=A0A420HWB4_9PEZI|nr:hypothetical protein OnM2_039027 [Erysiphe neolycopersici]
MDVFYGYTYGSSLWITIQALSLIISPKLTIALISTGFRQPSEVEEHLSTSLGIALLTISILTILLTGSIPLTSSYSIAASTDVTTDRTDSKAPYALPTLIITSIFHSAMAAICYARYIRSNQTSFILGSIGSACLAFVGLWCLLFASEKGHVSKKTGADKRTSGFPFYNKNTTKALKKRMQ